jgi:hypothetical protein
MALKFAILVVAQDSPKYNRLRRKQEKTWVKDFKDVARVFYVYGEKSSTLSDTDVHKEFLQDPTRIKTQFTFPHIREEKGDLVCESAGGWAELLPNTLSALKFLLDNYNFDYIIRTNLSTYWNKEPLLNLIRRQESAPIFTGPIVEANEKKFVAGYAMVFSKETIRRLIDNPELINFSLIDDVAISASLANQSIYPTHIEIPWVTIRNFLSLFLPSKFRKNRPLAINSIQDLSLPIAIRCREDRRIGPFNFRMDFLHYTLIHHYLTMASRKNTK